MSVEERLNELKIACDPYATCSNNMANESCNEKYACGKCRLGLIAKLEQELADEYVRLPVDADGVPTHVGDEVTCGANVWTVTAMKLLGEGWGVSCTVYNEHGGSGTTIYPPSCLHHYHKPTLEEALEELADEAVLITGKYREGTIDYEKFLAEIEALPNKYAAKVRKVIADE